MGVTTYGSIPAADTPTDIKAFIGTEENIEYLAFDLDAQADGTVVKIILQTMRGSVYSKNTDVLTITVDAIGPTAPAGGDSIEGKGL